MNLGAAYASLTTDQLKRMLAAARDDHKRRMTETEAKWSAEVVALRQTISHNKAKWMFEVQLHKNENAALRRELDAAYDELQRANIAITELERKMKAHNAVAALEKQLSAARRLAS